MGSTSTMNTISTNTTSTRTLPSWLPSGFDVAHDGEHCVTPRRQLTSFAIYNCIAIGTFLLIGNTVCLKWITAKRRARTIAHDRWSFWSGLLTLSLQIIPIVITVWLIQQSGYQASMWDLIQLWALRPRVAWFVGNFARTRREWGYVNGALSSVFAEVILCGFATVFLGRTLQAAFKHPTPEAVIAWTWYVVVIASMAMLLSTGFEILWALWMLKRFLEQKGRAEAQDMDSLLWILRIVVPVTALSSWLIWIAFLYASQGAYCPGTIKWVDVVWGVSPVVMNVLRTLLEQYTW